MQPQNFQNILFTSIRNMFVIRVGEFNLEANQVKVNNEECLINWEDIIEWWPMPQLGSGNDK